MVRIRSGASLCLLAVCKKVLSRGTVVPAFTYVLARASPPALILKPDNSVLFCNSLELFKLLAQL